MDYEVVCPEGHQVRVTETQFDQEMQCPQCGLAFIVPNLSRPADPSGIPEIEPEEPLRGTAARPGPFDLNHFSLTAGRPMLAIGLILVLFSRGCDSIGKRAVSRAQGKAQMARSTFQDEWEESQMEIERKIEALQSKEEPSPEDSKLITEYRKDLSNLREDQQKAQKALERGTWRDLDIAARDAAASNQIGAYWREVFFVFATLILATGLLAVSWTAQGAERWVCLIMLAILTFSIYIAGAAWAGPPA